MFTLKVLVHKIWARYSYRRRRGNSDLHRRSLVGPSPGYNDKSAVTVAVACIHWTFTLEFLAGFLSLTENYQWREGRPSGVDAA